MGGETDRCCHKNSKVGVQMKMRYNCRQESVITEDLTQARTHTHTRAHIQNQIGEYKLKKCKMSMWTNAAQRIYVWLKVHL